MSNETLEKENKLNMEFSKLASEDALKRAMAGLMENGIESFAYDSQEDLKNKLFEILPAGAQVMTMTSVTLDKLGITDEILETDKYDAVRNKIETLDKREQRKLKSCADYSVGSVHAVTENGEVMIASATGSQLPGYAYGSEKVIWIVGTQKIVRDQDEGIQRIREYCLPLEDARARQAYNEGSKIGKVLTINSEKEGRMTLLFLKENIGF